jgi:hypothetical protein
MIRERLDYVESGLLPLGKFLLLGKDLSHKERDILEKRVKKLDKVRKNLNKKAELTLFRYAKLLLQNKMPEELVPHYADLAANESLNQTTLSCEKVNQIYEKLIDLERADQGQLEL